MLRLAVPGMMNPLVVWYTMGTPPLMLILTVTGAANPCRDICDGSLENPTRPDGGTMIPTCKTPEPTDAKVIDPAAGVNVVSELTKGRALDSASPPAGTAIRRSIRGAAPVTAITPVCGSGKPACDTDAARPNTANDPTAGVMPRLSTGGAVARATAPGEGVLK